MKSSFSRLFGKNPEKETEEEETEDEITSDNDSSLQLADQLEELTKEDVKDHVVNLNVVEIIPNRFQPRTIFDDEKITELARTIHTHGIIQPIVVREFDENKFEIIAGERRWRAVSELGWKTIPAIVKNLSDTETASVALIENLQREELTPIEEAVAYLKLIELHDLTQEALAQRLGKGQSTVANKLRLLKLPDIVQTGLLDKKISERHARAIIPLKDPELQEKIYQEIVEKSLNVKQTEERVKALLEPKRKKPRVKIFSRDARLALNTIRQSLTKINDTGIALNSEEEDFEDYYQITIQIPKNKK